MKILLKDYLYIFGTIFFTVYGQMIIKWQVSKSGILPQSAISKLKFFLSLLLNPWVISSFTSAFIAALCWMAAMSKFELSYAYPFMSLSFVFVMIFSAVFFQEPLNISKVLGLSLIIVGIIVGSK